MRLKTEATHGQPWQLKRKTFSRRQRIWGHEVMLQNKVLSKGHAGAGLGSRATSTIWEKTEKRPED